MPIYFETVPEENLKVRRKFYVAKTLWRRPTRKKDPFKNPLKNQDGKISRKKMKLIQKGLKKKLLEKNANEKNLCCTYQFWSSELTLEKGWGLQMPNPF